MHIVCCVKQVPDTAQVKIDRETNTLVRTGVESICNPYDLAAVEAVVRLVEKHGGKSTVVSMGPPQSESALRECLSLGINEAVLLSDRAFAGADTLATSYTLARAILKLSQSDPVDLVMCGKQAIDGDTAQTGPGIATRLGFQQVTYVSQVIGLDPGGRLVTVRRRLEDGEQVVEAQLPALLTVELDLAIPRYATLPELVRSLRQEVTVWTAADIGVSPSAAGLKGSPTSVRQIFVPPARSGGVVFDDPDASEAVTRFVATFFSREPGILSDLGLVKAENAQE